MLEGNETKYIFYLQVPRKNFSVLYQAQPSIKYETKDWNFIPSSQSSLKMFLINAGKHQREEKYVIWKQALSQKVQRWATEHTSEQRAQGESTLQAMMIQYFHKVYRYAEGKFFLTKQEKQILRNKMY